MAKGIDELRAKMPAASLARLDDRMKRTTELVALHALRRTQGLNQADRMGDSAEQRKADDDNTKLQWLRSAGENSFASIDCGEGTKFESVDDLAAFIEQIGVGVASQIVIAGEADS